jgi:serine phosphatase RsbU (regulator of sigma subunit)
MDRSLKRFARRILLVHLALLVPLLAVVFLASLVVYHSAREQALEQAQKQQSLLVNETASGLKGYYDSIFSDLELFKPINPDDEDTDERIPEDEMGQQSFRNARTFRVPPMLPLQLNGRVAHLFLVEKGTYVAHAYGKQPSSPTVKELVDRNHAWIDSLDKSTISSLEQFDDRANDTVRGYTLIGVPVGPKKGFVLIASVSVRATAKRYFDDVNRAGDRAAFLLDESMAIMAASKPELIGTRVGGSTDASLDAAVSNLAAKGNDGTELVRKPFTLGSARFAPAMLSSQPVTVLDKQWYVMIASPLSEIDAVVSRLFGRAVLWAVFVALSMTAVLVSTAVQLIRNRARTERERHELLEKELKQAREIQLAWLPQRHPAGAMLDLATANQPASRISGDFYNWFELPDGRTAVVIGDVTGHGMAAAFLMATTQLLVRNTMPQYCDPGKCLEEINRQLCGQVFNGQFVTLQILVFDPLSARVDIGTAGHPPPLIGDAEGFRPLTLEPHLVLGVESNSTYSTESFELPAGASILLYTDGVFDAESPTRERFGMDRLRNSLRGAAETAQAHVDAILRSIDKFRAGYPLCDDLTLVAIQLQAQPAAGPSARRRVPVPAPA